MGGKLREYEGEEIVVRYDVKRCIHAEECVRGLPQVFDSKRRPWVDPAAAAAERVAEVVLRCPTGALHYERRDGGAPEMPPGGNRVRVAADGPLYLHGELVIEKPGAEPQRETRAALCRCGDSHNKPYCDNTHLEKGFRDPGGLGEVRLRTVDPPPHGGALRITVRPAGPLILDGPLELAGALGDPAEGNKTALCRCGASSNKPFCDGSHAVIGFEG